MFSETAAVRLRCNGQQGEAEEHGCAFFRVRPEIQSVCVAAPVKRFRIQSSLATACRVCYPPRTKQGLRWRR